MARPKPDVLLEHNNLEIIEADGWWAITYENKPFRMRTFSYKLKNGRRHRQAMFTNESIAQTFCDKLNRRFKTIEFRMVKLKQ